MKRNDRERPNGTAGTPSTNRDDSLGGRLRGRSGSGSRSRRVVVLMLVVCGLAAVPVVSAHAYLVASTPEEGAQLADAPETVTLRFSSSVKSANITVADFAGHRMDRGSVSRINKTTFQVPLSDLDPGAYTVKWQIVSADGHQLDGSFTFVVVGGETSPSQSMTKTTAQPPTETGTTPVTTPTPESTERPTGTATVTATAEPTTDRAATTQTATATNGQARTTESTGAGFDLAAAAIAGIVLIVSLLVFRGWRE